MSGDDDYQPKRRDPWAEYALDKVSEMLISQEVAQEDRNGTFTMIGVAGLLFIGGSWWHSVSQPIASWQDAAGFVVGLVLLVSGIALRINGQLDLRRNRRAQKVLEIGRLSL